MGAPGGQGRSGDEGAMRSAPGRQSDRRKEPIGHHGHRPQEAHIGGNRSSVELCLPTPPRLFPSPHEPGCLGRIGHLLLAGNPLDGGLPAETLEFFAGRTSRSSLWRGDELRPRQVRAALWVRGVTPLARSVLNLRS